MKHLRLTQQLRDWQHRVRTEPDDGGPITFRWHFPRGVLDRRMSAWELAPFLMSHMPAIVPLLSYQPRTQAEFQALLLRFATWGQAALDELVPWVKTIIHGEEDDIVVLELHGKTPPPVGPTYFTGL